MGKQAGKALAIRVALQAMIDRGYDPHRRAFGIQHRLAKHFGVTRQNVSQILRNMERERAERDA